MPTRHTSLLTAIVLAQALAGVTPARAATDPAKVNGAYDVVLAGAFTGDGHAAVGAKQVNLNVTVTDATSGQSGKLIAHLPLNNGRFTGTGSVLGLTVTFEGRVEAADGNLVKSARLLCTFGTSDNRAGRLVGHREGS